MADQYRVTATVEAQLVVEAGSGYEAERKFREHFQEIEDQDALKRDYEAVEFTVRGVDSRTPLQNP